MPIKHVKLWDDSDFKPEGGTALCDAVGRTINDLGSRLEAMAEYRRPNKVVVLIISDGEENASSYYPRQKISNMIDHQHDKYSWEFVFLGTNQDSFKSGAELSIKRNNTKNYQPTAAGMSAALKVAGACMDTYRTMPQNYTKGNFYNNAAALKSGSTIEDTIPVEPISPTVSLDPSMRSMIAEEDAKVLSAINLANFQGAAGKVDDSMEQLREFLKKKCQPV
jgi:hypothetical protein